MDEAAAHSAKLAKWLQMAPPRSRQLGEGIVSRFVPLLKEAGFQEVTRWYGDPAFKVTGREIRLERWRAATIDSVHIAFDKYRDPRLSISMARRDKSDPLKIIRGAHVTKSRRNYYDWWGKPWWMPTRLWPAGAPAKIVGRLVGIGPQITTFLDHGERGPNIGRSVDGIAY